MDKQVTLLKYDFGRRVASPFKSDNERLKIKNGMVYTKSDEILIIPKKLITLETIKTVCNYVVINETEDNYLLYPMNSKEKSIARHWDMNDLKVLIDGKIKPIFKLCDTCPDRLRGVVGECRAIGHYGLCDNFMKLNNAVPRMAFDNRAYIKESHCYSYKEGYDFSLENIAKARMKFKERYNRIQIALKLTEIICKGKDCVKLPRCGYKRNGFQHNEVTIDGEPKNNCLMSESDGRETLVEKIKQEYGSLSKFLKLLYYCGRVLKIKSTDGHKRRYIIGFPKPDDTFKCVTDYPPYKNEYTVTLKEIENMVESRPPDLRKYSKSERERIGSVAYAFMHSSGAFYGHSNWFLGIEWCVGCHRSHKDKDHIHTISGSTLTQYRYPNSDTLKGVYEIRSYVGDIFNR